MQQDEILVGEHIRGVGARRPRVIEVAGSCAGRGVIAYGIVAVVAANNAGTGAVAMMFPGP